MSTPAPSANKPRSPNYPSIGLGEAIQRLEIVYEKQRQYLTSRDVIAKNLGYSGVNGASATLISALSKYGLIEGYGEKLKVSDVGRDLVLHRRGDPEYAIALQAAAFTPVFFQEMRQQYPHGLPSEHSIRAWLVKRGFSDKAIGNAVRAYRDTMEFVDAETEGATAALLDDSLVEATMQTQPVAPPTRAIPAPSIPINPTQRSVALPLSLSEWATLQAPFPLTEAAWDQMLAVLTAMKPGLVAVPDSVSKPLQKIDWARPDQPDPSPLEGDSEDEEDS